MGGLSLGGRESAYPFGTILDITAGIPYFAEHPELKSGGRVNGLLETPYHRPATRKTSINMKTTVHRNRRTDMEMMNGMLSRVFAWAPKNDASASEQHHERTSDIR